MDVKELKEILHLDGSTHLNVFFANSSDEDLAGVATWPWDKEALTHLGRGQKTANNNIHACTHAHVHMSLVSLPRLWERDNASFEPVSIPQYLYTRTSLLCFVHTAVFTFCVCVSFLRWNRAEPFLLWHIRPHRHDGPRDWSQSWALPRLPRYIRD